VELNQPHLLVMLSAHYANE